MGALDAVDWPPAPLVTSRLVLRQTEARDRAGYLALLTSDDVRRYLGGALPVTEVERSMPEVPGRYAGLLAIELAGRFAGAVLLERRGLERQGHVREDGNELEISVTLLPEHWGYGYAQEAVEAVLAWASALFPGEPVLFCTQTANARARTLAERLGFRQLATLDEFGAEQWLGMRSLPGTAGS